MVLAEAFQMVFDNAKADDYFKKAISNINPYTDSSLNKITIIRIYANFLYQIGRPKDGSDQYETAILQNESSEASLTNGFTFQMKFWNETEMENFEEAIESYKQAKKYYLSIQNKSLQRHNIKNLESAWELRQIPHGFSRP